MASFDFDKQCFHNEMHRFLPVRFQFSRSFFETSIFFHLLHILFLEPPHNYNCFPLVKYVACITSNARKSVSSDIQTEKWVEKMTHIQIFFNQLRNGWISGKTLFLVFDTGSQGINNSYRNKSFKGKVHRIL